MPISTQISLIPETDVTLRPTMGHHAHAAFLAIIRESNPDLAETLHAQSTQKPFTVSPLIAEAKKRNNLLHIRAGTECKLRFTFLDDELFQHFGKAFLTLTMPPIRLGEAVFQVRQMVSHATEARSWGKSETYAELVESAKTDTRMSFRFYSPTAFRKMTPRGQKTRNDTYVDLVRCYQSWVNKWNAFAPIKLDKAEVLAFVTDHAQVTSVTTKSRALNFGRHTEVGWVGTCACVFYPEDSLDEHLLRTANCLADFAFYCGTGYKTTMGMGQTRRVD
ncbi:MAG: CRISPR-associated endoribonuclease Cas6 [Candidatus Poribacteria bacterium]|nr:CRISPR-associated endoribonuclease Cas6 [Candidatus Poribacteria bacterium]